MNGGFHEIGYAFDEFGKVRNGTEGVHVDLMLGVGLGGEAEGDTYVSIENVRGAYGGSNTIIGNDVANKLSGGDKADVIKGGGGDDDIFASNGHDKITGGAGSDILNGFPGSDTFIYEHVSYSTAAPLDVIKSFDHYWSLADGSNYDEFDFSAIDADANQSGNQALDWIGEGFFYGVGQIREVRGDTATYVEVNLDDNFEDAEMVILIEDTINLNADDFIL